MSKENIDSFMVARKVLMNYVATLEEESAYSKSEIERETFRVLIAALRLSVSILDKDIYKIEKGMLEYVS